MNIRKYENNKNTKNNKNKINKSILTLEHIELIIFKNARRY